MPSLSPLWVFVKQLNGKNCAGTLRKSGRQHTFSKWKLAGGLGMSLYLPACRNKTCNLGLLGSEMNALCTFPPPPHSEEKVPFYFSKNRCRNVIEAILNNIYTEDFYACWSVLVIFMTGSCVSYDAERPEEKSEQRRETLEINSNSKSAASSETPEDVSAPCISHQSLSLSECVSPEWEQVLIHFNAEGRNGRNAETVRIWI